MTHVFKVTIHYTWRVDGQEETSTVIVVSGDDVKARKAAIADEAGIYHHKNYDVSYCTIERIATIDVMGDDK